MEIKEETVVTCSELSLNSDHVIFLDHVSSQKPSLQLNKNTVLPLSEITDPIEQPGFDWVFPVKSILQEEPPKDNALAQSLCFWQTHGVLMKTGTKKFSSLFVKVETCKFRHLHVLWTELEKTQARQAPEPGENSTDQSSGAHSRIFTLPSLDCLTLYCL